MENWNEGSGIGKKKNWDGAKIMIREKVRGGRGVFICHGNAFTTDSFQFGKLSRPRFSTVFVRKYEALENLGRGINRQW